MSVFEDSKDIIKTDLDNMSNLLITSGICSDTSPLQQAIGHVYSHSNEEIWEYKINDLTFKLDKYPHVIPHEAEYLELYLSMYLKGVYSSDTLTNPLMIMEFNIVVKGIDSDANDLLAAWHFDKHVPEKGEEESKFIHPEYHFTYGGNKMWNIPDLNWGASLILPTPRFAHPPLDGILGIDFVLGNYIKKDKRYPITKLPEYKKMIQRSQTRMWRPYYLSISNYWTKNSNDTMDLELLIPNLL